MRAVSLGWLVVLAAAAAANAQSSSLMRLPVPRPTNPVAAGCVPAPAGSAFTAMPPRETSRPGTRAVELVSMIAVPPVPPRKFHVEDLITIIVRQQKKYEAEGKLDNKKKWDLGGKLSDWFRFYPGGNLGQDKLSNGDPGVKFNLDNKYRAESTNDREDSFTTRIQARIIDVKPNGNLVLEARAEEQHDEEKFTITLTGVCRSEDVTPVNTVMSTQIAELVLVEVNHGAVREATRRGWVPKLLDMAGAY